MSLFVSYAYLVFIRLHCDDSPEHVNQPLGIQYDQVLQRWLGCSGVFICSEVDYGSHVVQKMEHSTDFIGAIDSILCSYLFCLMC